MMRDIGEALAIVRRRTVDKALDFALDLLIDLLNEKLPDDDRVDLQAARDHLWRVVTRVRPQE